MTYLKNWKENNMEPNENIEKEPIDVNTQELRKFEEEEN